MREFFSNENKQKGGSAVKQETPENFFSKSAEKKEDEKKNMRWKDEEHILYILFLE